MVAAGMRDVLTREEATARVAAVSDVSYEIAIELKPEDKTYRGDVTAYFSGSSEDLFLEFVGGTIEVFSVNGYEREADWDGARIALPLELLGEENEVRVRYENPYDRTGEGFHHFIDPEDGSEYLYTQFEPYSAHRVFPCFDQPDIKATYEISVVAPAEWEVVTSSRQIDIEDADGGRTLRRFEKTVPFSTYLVSLIAGPYAVVRDEHNGLPLGLFCRRSFADHMDAENIFKETKDGLDIFSRFFGAPYPFTKYDQLFVPEFNWGGMENVAAVTYTDSLIFRDPPTRDQVMRRSEILLHELAHMWFGDLVTMTWWNDLWLNESFATFIAYLALEEAGYYDDLWQDFNTRNKLVAYRDDQLPTTHPIADESVGNTDEIFLNFDQITYGKGASALRQLVAAIGTEGFLAGLRTYFERHSFSNTTLADFLASLQEGSGQDLASWAARWLRTPSLNTLAAEWHGEGGLLTSLSLRQTAPDDYPTLRPHTVEIALVSETGGNLSLDAVKASIDDSSEAVDGASGLAAPSLVFPNYNDLTFAKVALDAASLDFVKSGLSRIDDSLLRHQLWQSLWEMLRDREISSLEYLQLIGDQLRAEPSTQIIRMVTGLTLFRTLSSYVPEHLKDAEIRNFVALAREAIDVAAPGDGRVLWARALVGAATDPEDLALAGRIVDDTEGVEGLPIDQEMRWTVAVRWSAMGVAGAAARVEAELARDRSDRGKRAALRADVSRPDADTKAEAWARLHDQGYESLHMAAAAMGGFGWWKQADLLAPYAEEFFQRVAGVIDEWEFEAAKAYFYGLYPGYRVDSETLAATKALIGPDTDVRLARLAIETVDELERSLACRQLAAPELSPPGETG